MCEQWKDPIVEEIHRIREQIARECGYDLRRIVERLREHEKQHPERVVTELLKRPKKASG